MVVDGQDAEGRGGESATIAEDRAVAQGEIPVVIPSTAVAPGAAKYGVRCRTTVICGMARRNTGAGKSRMYVVDSCLCRQYTRRQGNSRDYVSRGPDIDSSFGGYIHGDDEALYTAFSVGFSVE